MLEVTCTPQYMPAGVCCEYEVQGEKLVITIIDGAARATKYVDLSELKKGVPPELIDTGHKYLEKIFPVRCADGVVRVTLPLWYSDNEPEPQERILT